jgi:hypothetical protein
MKRCQESRLIARARRLATVVLITIAAGGSPNAAEILTSGDKLAVDVSPDGNSLALDLLGDIWVMPASGGEARLLLGSAQTLSDPRWSPDGKRILYHRQGPGGVEVWIVDTGSGESRRIGDGHMQDASWHPDGDRILFSAERNETGLDLWEIDVPTGLAWRLTSDPGDETDGTWSANGLHLAWVSRVDDHYELRIRRRGQAPIGVVSAEEAIAAPSWRPDGSLLTYQLETDEGTALEMAILSEPVLIRRIESREDLVRSPVSWRDRMTMYYAADDSIRSRGFEDRRSRPVHFRAIVELPEPPPKPAIVAREIPLIDPPGGRLIVRGARLFDGVWKGYRENLDVVIEGGRIAAVTARRDRDDGVLIDLGDVTILPGLVDADSGTPESLDDGPLILAFGVTTIVTEEPPAFDTTAWSGETMPGPRVVVASDRSHIAGTVSFADAGTPGIGALLSSRQATAAARPGKPGRRFAGAPDLAPATTRFVIGSRPNDLAPGLSVHGELRALQAAGLSGEQALHAAGRNSAVALGVEHQVGTIIEGALADLVLVRGDPLKDVAEALNVIAVVRNGRLFSMISLLERTNSARNVE